MREKISELLDDELETEEQEEVLRFISQDAELAATWQRYHLIRAAVRNESISHVPVFPQRMQTVLSGDKEMPRHKPQRNAVIRLGKWAPGFALAASLAGLAVFGFFKLQPGQEMPTASNRNDIAQIDRGTKWETLTPGLEHALNTFLVEHGEFTPMSSMNGLMAYAKFVSYDSTE